MLEYDVKILLAFGKALDGYNEYFEWLLNNGYPELAALSNAIRGDEGAVQWLLKSNYPQYGVLSNAMDNETNAVQWLIDFKDEFLLQFAQASRGNEDSIEWLRRKQLNIFIMLAEKINKILKFQVKENTFWYKIKF
ncbi:MAG: hypothetical protein WCL51_13750 [Bacteroidota bacterium]